MSDGAGVTRLTSEYRFSCGLANGFHARPASVLAEAARGFAVEITIAKVAGGAPVSLTSVLSVIGLDIKRGDACVLCAFGVDASDAIAALRELIEGRLAETDEHPDASTQQRGNGRLPVGLRKLNVAHAFGRCACAGLATGVAVAVEGLVLPDELRDARPNSPEAEIAAVRDAVVALHAGLKRQAASASGTAKELLAAHGEIANDPALLSEIERHIRGGTTAAQGVIAALERFVMALRGATSEYVRDRAVDVQDVCGQLLDKLTGGRLSAPNVSLSQDSVVFAEVLTPGQLLRMDRRFLRGLVLGPVGATSHTVILARSFRIPTLIDVPGVATVTRHGQTVAMDADNGYVTTAVTRDVARYFEREQRTRRRLFEKVAPLAAATAMTSDGVHIEVGANASTAEEVEAAVLGGAEGVGLLRTELIFLDRATAPSEDEQYRAYAAVTRAAQGRPVIIRTFDIGGDKPAAYLPMPREENPFLGVRGLRLYEPHPAILRAQLRAIVRASAIGPLKVMAPMVALPAEAAWFREQVRSVQAELGAEGASFDSGMPVGVMVEVPAAALAMDRLCEEVDFFSIGTNDLCQYWMAVDRGNPGVASLYNARHPSFLRLLRAIVQGAKAKGKWIGVCGEMASDRRNLPLMLGLGVDEISVSPGEIPAIKAAIRGLTVSRSVAAVESATNCRDAVEVDSVLRGIAEAGALPIVAEELVEPCCDAVTKEEAIKDAVDLLYVGGRTEEPGSVEDAVWAREATYSTGLGFGFAVPHCKTEAVRAPTLAVLKCQSPIDWGSADGLPVRIVLLLAIPAADTTGAHMKVFAKLARRLMHEEFRERLLGAADGGALVRCLNDELGLDQA